MRSQSGNSIEHAYLGEASVVSRRDQEGKEERKEVGGP